MESDKTEFHNFAYLTNKEGRIILCGLAKMIFTTALIVDSRNGWYYDCRYCYHTYEEAKDALNNWDGLSHPPGNWIKMKGREELGNPYYINVENDD